MSGVGLLFFLFSFLFEIISAPVLTYAIATSKADSKKVIKTVLLGIAVYAITVGGMRLTFTGPGIVISGILSVLVGLIIFSTLGSQTGIKFNTGGFISMAAYLISLFLLRILSNKYEDTLGYKAAEAFAGAFGVEFTPTQWGILNMSLDSGDGSGISLLIMFVGAVLFAILFFEMALLRKNAAQVFMGGMVAICTAGMLYLDNSIVFHPNSSSLKDNLGGFAASATGFSLSASCIVIVVLAILPVITAYQYKKKENENE